MFKNLKKNSSAKVKLVMDMKGSEDKWLLDLNIMGETDTVRYTPPQRSVWRPSVSSGTLFRQ